ncbi:MAG: DUF4394 domain-containing protein [Gemmatimonadales bacterium]
MNPERPKTLGLTALLLGTLAVLACGGGSGLTDPPPDDDPGPEPPAPVQGYSIYAVDLDNRLLLFGSESPTTISRIVSITGLPILNRIVGIDFQPSTGELYGIGNDSRVYVLDPQTGVATAVSPTRFEPHIASFFDIHFGMGFDPVTERIRLIAAESGANWSVDPDDGTAVRGQDVHYAAGDPNEGRQPSILGLAYTPPGDGTADGRALHAAHARLLAQGPCEDLLWAIDAELAELIGSCDPDEGDFTSLGPIPGIVTLAGCGEIKFGPEGNLFATLLRSAEELNSLVNSLATIDPETGAITWRGDIPDDSPIQTIAFDPNVPASPAFRRTSVAALASVAPSAAGDVLAPAGSGELPSCAGAPR